MSVAVIDEVLLPLPLSFSCIFFGKEKNWKLLGIRFFSSNRNQIARYFSRKYMWFGLDQRFMSGSNSEEDESNSWLDLWLNKNNVSPFDQKMDGDICTRGLQGSIPHFSSWHTEIGKLNFIGKSFPENLASVLFSLKQEKPFSEKSRPRRKLHVNNRRDVGILWNPGYEDEDPVFVGFFILGNGPYELVFFRRFRIFYHEFYQFRYPCLEYISRNMPLRSIPLFRNCLPRVRVRGKK